MPRKTVWVFAVPSISGDFRTQVEARQATGVRLLCSPEEGSPASLLRNSLGARVHGVQVSVHLYLLGIWERPGVFRVRLIHLSTEKSFLGSHHL